MFSSAKVRERSDGEIVPQKAEQSATEEGDEATWGASHAIDLDLETMSYTVADVNGKRWLKLTLSQVYCVHQVLRHDDVFFQTWTCSPSSCSCQGAFCGRLDLKEL